MGERRTGGGCSAYILMAAWLTFGWPRCALSASNTPDEGLRLALSRELKARAWQANPAAAQAVDRGEPVRLALADRLGEGPPLAVRQGSVPPGALAFSADPLADTVTTGDADYGGGPGSGAVPGEDAAAAGREDQGLFSRIRRLIPWRLAPIRTWGTLGYTYRSLDAAGRKTRNNILTATLNGRSYIWRPWFAVLDGGVSLSQDWASGQNATGSQDVTGNASLGVFPDSRFPFEAHYSVTDSRTDTALENVTGYAYRYKRLGFSQRYQPLRGNARYHVSYDQSTQTAEQGGTGGGDYRQRQMQFDMSTYFGKQNLSVTASTNRNERADTGESALYNTLDLRHTYTPNPQFSVDSQATYNDNRYNYSTLGTSSQFLQLNSYAYWRPEDMPLTVNGGARLYTLDSGPTSLRSLNLNGGAIYRLNRNVNLNGAANVNQTSSNGASSMSSTQSLGASYQSDTVDFGKYRYYWFGSGTASNRTGTDTGRHLTLVAGHGLNRTFETGPDSALTASLSQSIANDLDTVTASTRRLSNNAALNWNKGGGKTTTLVRLSATDSRSLKDDGDVMQMVNFQATVNTMLSRHASLTGDLTIQTSHQKTPGQPDTGFTTSSSGNLTYRNQRFFGVRRLHFTSQLSLYGQGVVPVLSGPQEDATRSWENRLDYTLGRTRLQAIGRISRLGDQTATSLMFNAIRTFGDM